MTTQPQNYPVRTGFEIPDGLKKIIEEAKLDDQLLICLRGEEIHIYYRGGKILGLKKNKESVTLSFDKKYLKIKNRSLADQCRWLMDINGSERKLVENNPRDFFDAAKKVMNEWFDLHKKQERDDQHRIALCNSLIGNDEDLAVVDIEYAVSANSPCYNKRYKDTFGNYERYPNPRFDIIAINRLGRIYVIELKTGLNSTKNSSTHITDFVSMIGSHRSDPLTGATRYKVFLEEMSKMISVLNENHLRGGLQELPEVDMTKPPVFGFAYTVDKEPKCKGHTPEYQIKRIEEIVSKAMDDAVASSESRCLDNDVKEMIDGGYVLQNVMIIGEDYKLK